MIRELDGRLIFGLFPLLNFASDALSVIEFGNEGSCLVHPGEVLNLDGAIV
jgi:hypothetical protein